jgi:hypothetical protein
MSHPLGRPASRGSGPESYTVRLPIWLAANVRLAGLEQLPPDELFSLRTRGLRAELEKIETFLILWIRGFATDAEARSLLGRVTLALIRLTGKRVAAIRFNDKPSEIAMGSNDPNAAFREQLDLALYPTDWNHREDGSKTDGGIFPFLTYIIPEHKRIWEYPSCYGTIIRPLDVSDIADAVESAADDNISPAFNDPVVPKAGYALQSACAEEDRTERFIRLVKVLDILSEDNGPQNPPAKICSEIKQLIKDINLERACREDLAGALEEIDRKIPASMNNRIRTLLTTVCPGQPNLPGRILKLRGKFAHGAGHQPPPADEVEELHKVVCACLDYRIEALRERDCSGVPAQTAQRD